METQPLKPGLDKPPPYSATPSAPTLNTSWHVPPVNHATQCGAFTVWQPPPGYYPATGSENTYENSYIPSYGSTHTTTTTVIIPEIIRVGGCPACRVGIMEDYYTFLGLLCAILFFPFGIICCLLWKTRRCSNCGAYFG